MDGLDAITEMLTNNPVATALADAAEGFPPSDIPSLPIPGVGGGPSPSLPFGQMTAAALQNSAGDFAEFVTGNLPDYGTRTATAIRTTAEAYSDAFQSLAAAFQGLAPMPGAPDMGGDAPGMATAEALAAGFDGLGEAVALSLGNEMGYGAVYAAETIGEALTAAGGDIAEGFATGADVIEALADAIVDNAPDAPAPAPGGDGPEAQLVDALEGGFEQLIAGYNTGAEALSGALPDAIADGIQTVGASFLEGAMTVTSTIVEQIEGFSLPGGTGGAPSAPELPAPLADAAEQLQGAFEDGAAQLMDLLGSGAPSAPEIPAPLADAAEQLQAAFEDGAAQLMDLPGAIQAGITSLASQFPADLPAFPV